MPNLDTSSVMFLGSLDVSGLSTSYALLQVTQPGLIRPQLVSRWLASYHDSMAPLFWATAILRLSLPHRWYCGWLSSFSHPRCLNYWRLWPRKGCKSSASNLHRETPCSPASLLAVTDQSCVLGELPLKGFFQAIFPRDCQLQQHCLLGGLRHKDNGE